MGKAGTQLLRHCVRLLVLVSTDLLAVRLSGIVFLFLDLYLLAFLCALMCIIRMCFFKIS